MSRLRLFVLAAFAAPVLLGAAACDNGPAAPTTDTPTTNTPVVSPVTESFASQVAVGGSSSRTFTAAKSGTATVTLNAVGSSSTLKLGLGLGIPDAAGSGCLFMRSIETAAGGAISTSVDPGVFCVRVYDLGTLTATTNFTATIIRP